MLNLPHRLSNFQIPPCFLHVAGLPISQACAKSQIHDVNNHAACALHC